jgi:hypothetical protein
LASGPGISLISVVMPGFRPGIHEFAGRKLVDAKAKPWHDERVWVLPQSFFLLAS